MNIINKLKKFPHILWINLAKDTRRKKYMELLFSQCQLANTRIDAINGIDYEKYCYTTSILKTKEETGTIGCFLSHLKTLEHFVNTPSLGEFCLIAEDDLSFEYLPFWKKTFWEYINDAPKDFNVIQLTLTYSYAFLKNYKHLYPKKHIIRKHENYMYGAGCYLIKRSCAKKLVKIIPKNNNKYNLKVIKNSISDCFIYQSLRNVYSLPLFTFNTSIGSNIHEEHIDRIHIPCKNLITKIWKNTD